MKTNAPIPQSTALAKAQEMAKADDRKLIPEPYIKTAQNMEQQFVEFMLQEMEKTTGQESETASDYYKSLMRSENAEQMVTGGKGLGIQDLILDQIYPKHRRSEMAYNAYKQQVDQQMGNKPSYIRMDQANPDQSDIKMAIEKTLREDKQDE